MGPNTEIDDQPSGRMSLATSPGEGRKPTTPHSADGVRSEPPVSDPVHSGNMSQAKAAADPPEDPPAFSSGLKGLPVAPQTGLRLLPPAPMSGVLVLAVTMAPASRRRATSETSFSGTCPRKPTLPLVVSKPAVACKSFTPKGKPCKAGSGSPRMTCDSATRAWSSARSKSVTQIALTAGL